MADMAEQQKLLIMVVHGPDDPELATLAFVMAGAAVASDVTVVMGFQADGVRLVQEGAAEKIHVPEFEPLGKLLDDVRSLGGTFLVCGPCIRTREIPPESLVAGAEVVNAGRFVAEITSATNALVY